MNKRALRPRMECLEGKALQSSGTMLAHHVPSLQFAPIARRTGLTATLTTDRRVYRAGQPVVITLKETNPSNRSVSVSLGPSIGGFYVTQRGSVVWSSNPGIQPHFVVQKLIPPHGSITLSATWDGLPSGATLTSPSGIFQVHTQASGARPVSVRFQRG